MDEVKSFNDVPDITWSSEDDVRPSATVAADMDGDASMKY